MSDTREDLQDAKEQYVSVARNMRGKKGAKVWHAKDVGWHPDRIKRYEQEIKPLLTSSVHASGVDIDTNGRIRR